MRPFGAILRAMFDVWASPGASAEVERGPNGHVDPPVEGTEVTGDAVFLARLSPPLRAALDERGYTTLTPVQRAMLDPELAGRDLRITSQTGSGKTLAFAFALEAAVVAEPEPTTDRTARPHALVIVPTRELAAQVQRELAWAFAHHRVGVAVVSGGASYRAEHRALAARPRVVVATPGRLFDQLEQGAIDPSCVRAVVLDEADEMLDLGFREALEAILSRLPEDRRTHLVSATFAAGVLGLAKRFQKTPASVEGTRLGAVHADIEHVAHLVPEDDYMGAIINLLLAYPEEQALVFCRTRANVAFVAEELLASGFPVAALSGEMPQEARNRSLGAFRSGSLRVLVATDVAARGIDVNIARVIQIDPPNDVEGYVHRSGRTGRAGRTGTSVLLTTPQKARRIMPLLARAGIHAKVEPVPSAESILRAADDRFLAELFGEGEGTPPSERHATLAQRIVGDPNSAAYVARLLAMVPYAGSTAPREVRSYTPPPPKKILLRDETPKREILPKREAGSVKRPKREPRVEGDRSFLSFRVNWGASQGADVRRLLAIVCRKGGIRGTDVGAIRIGSHHSTFEVDGAQAERFAKAVKRRDPRDPRLVFSPER